MNATNEVLAIADEPESLKPDQTRETRLRGVLNNYFDFDLITRRAIGPGWRQFSSAEQERAVELFRDLLLRTYANRLSHRDRPKIGFGVPIRISEDRNEVPTTVAYAGKSYAVAYRLERRPNGWRIYDFVVEGISFIGNYRAQFDALFQSKGAAGVLQILETKQVNTSTTTLP